MISSGSYIFGQGGNNTRVCNPGFSSALFNPVVLTKIEFENGQYYEFKYNVAGVLTQIIYPSGAYERFTYGGVPSIQARSEEHTSELQSLMRISYAVFCL